MDIVALCIWREARSEHLQGMSAVGAVIKNRARRHKMTLEQAVMVPWAFSSMTAINDPQLHLYPGDDDTQFKLALIIVDNLRNSTTILDPTFGATLYYDTSISFPKGWDKIHCASTVQIGRFKFYREI
jgi:hypothetical protein